MLSNWKLIQYFMQQADSQYDEFSVQFRLLFPIFVL